MQLPVQQWALLVVSLLAEVAEGRIFDFFLDLSIPQYYAGTEAAYNIIKRIPSYRTPRKLGKLQRNYEDMPFPCDVTGSRSPERPTSVHALRPGDIDVIAAMGDSLTAGMGALATDTLHVFIANRGVSFSGGGQSDWREYLTLPNILKAFNPQLIGHSLGDAVTWDRKAQFNVAEPGAQSSDIPHQARILVKRLKSDSRVNYQEDWKLVTLMIGPNDACLNLCYVNKDEVLINHLKDMHEALDYLYENIPRVLVNVIPMPNMKLLVDMTDRSTSCVLTTTFECPCLIGLPHASKKKRLLKLVQAWQQMDMDIGRSERYREKEDFAVVVQPFSMETRFPTRELPALGRNGSDYSYLAPDCFHFSQKAHAIAGTALWNNMMEPEGRKSYDWTYPVFKKFLCPSDEHPYIFTHSNSPST